MANALKPLVALAKSDTARALVRARGEPQAANRCQFLAWTARFAPDAAVVAIADEALAAAAIVDDDYWSVAIAAWPLRALVERGHERDCVRALAPVLARATRIAHPVSRMDALALVLHAVLDVDAARAATVPELVRACQAATSWKSPRCLADTAVLLAPIDEPAAAHVLAALADGRHKRQALRAFAAGAAPPRTFF
ncbi:MAG TPA: hypothetical protein VGL86_28190, partial [Polyangia bacterium]